MWGFIACILITLAYIPQCYSIFKTKNVEGLSCKTFLAIWIGMIFWMIHAIIIGDIPLFISSLASFIQNSYILYQILKSKRKCCT